MFDLLYDEIRFNALFKPIILRRDRHQKMKKKYIIFSNTLLTRIWQLQSSQSLNDRILITLLQVKSRTPESLDHILHDVTISGIFDHLGTNRAHGYASGGNPWAKHVWEGMAKLNNC